MTVGSSTSDKNEGQHERFYPFVGPGYDPNSGVLDAEPGDEIIIVINYAEFDPKLRKPVDTNMVHVYEGLARGDAPGYIGGSIILGFDEAWTMSAWRDEPSIVAFYSSPAHTQAIERSLPSVFFTRPARLRVPAREVPLDWGRAKAVCAQLGPDPQILRRGLHRDHS